MSVVRAVSKLFSFTYSVQTQLKCAFLEATEIYISTSLNENHGLFYLGCNRLNVLGGD